MRVQYVKCVCVCVCVWVHLQSVLLHHKHPEGLKAGGSLRPLACIVGPWDNNHRQARKQLLLLATINDHTGTLLY